MSALLFLYLRTGGGHLAPARALVAQIAAAHAGKARAVMVDGLEGGSRFARWVLEDGYRILQARARWYYEFLYLTNKIPAVASWNARLVIPFVRRRIEEAIRTERPDRIVVTHFLLIQPVLEVLHATGAAIPVTVLVTDPLTAHPLWFRNHGVDFVLFSEKLRAHCERLGIPRDRLHVFPFVLSRRFSAPLKPDAAAAVRRQLDFRTEGRIVLVLGGADGIPRGAGILKVLVRHVPGAQIAIVCGRDEGLRRRADVIRRASGRDDVVVYGYVDFAFELINAADVIISKCGASTFMEILLSGKIPVITDYLWEQEKGNVEFLVQSGSGFYEPRLARLPGLINRLLGEEDTASACRSATARLGLRNGTAEVAEFLVKSAEKRS